MSMKLELVSAADLMRELEETRSIRGKKWFAGSPERGVYLEWEYVAGDEDQSPYCLVLNRHVSAEVATSGKAFANWVYELDLEGADSTGELLDWIFQIRAKQFASPEVMHSLLKAVYDVLDPQATMCSWGASSKINDVAGFLKGRE